MDKNKRFQIITEAQENGISKTCTKYDISRTIYYRWLKRYQSLGMEGLEDVQKNFTPKNKTSEELEKTVLNLIKSYPTYGPKAISYLMEEIGYKIGESAVYNIMNRHHLTNKKTRLQYAKKRTSSSQQKLPNFEQFSNGECWFFWENEYRSPSYDHSIYAFTIMDYKTRIACSRLYDISEYENFEDVLTSTALPLSKSLHLAPKYICFFDSSKLMHITSNTLISNIKKSFLDSGIDIQVTMLPSCQETKEIQEIKEEYTQYCIKNLLQKMQENLSFEELKAMMQQYIRNYNLTNKITIGNEAITPAEYHISKSDTPFILPIWAYMNREY